MDTLLPRNKLPKTFNNERLRRKFVLHSTSYETLDHFCPVVQYESHDSFFVEVPGKKRIKTVINWELAHIYKYSRPLKQQRALMMRQIAVMNRWLVEKTLFSTVNLARRCALPHSCHPRYGFVKYSQTALCWDCVLQMRIRINGRRLLLIRPISTFRYIKHGFNCGDTYQNSGGTYSFALGESSSNSISGSSRS
jgi:hypothetical protein